MVDYNGMINFDASRLSQIPEKKQRSERNGYSGSRCCWLCVLLRLPRKLAYGKIEIETCAFAGFACDLDIPTMGFDNALTDGKAQARAFALFAFVLRRKERNKDIIQGLGRHAAARIGHLDLDP